MKNNYNLRKVTKSNVISKYHINESDFQPADECKKCNKTRQYCTYSCEEVKSNCLISSSFVIGLLSSSILFYWYSSINDTKFMSCGFSSISDNLVHTTADATYSWIITNITPLLTKVNNILFNNNDFTLSNNTIITNTSGTYDVNIKISGITIIETIPSSTNVPTDLFQASVSFTLTDSSGSIYTFPIITYPIPGSLNLNSIVIPGQEIGLDNLTFTSNDILTLTVSLTIQSTISGNVPPAIPIVTVNGGPFTITFTNTIV